MVGDLLEIEEAKAAAIHQAHHTTRSGPTPIEPTLAELASTFASAVSGWAAAGFPVTVEAVYAERAGACSRCEYWQEAARLGLGKCTAPGCGCTRLKRWLATERCVLGKWAR